MKKENYNNNRTKSFWSSRGRKIKRKFPKRILKKNKKKRKLPGMSMIKNVKISFKLEGVSVLKGGSRHRHCCMLRYLLP